MRKTMLSLLVLLAMLFMSVQVQAATDEFTTNSWKIDSDGVLQPIVAATGGNKPIFQIFATGEQLAAKETGKICIFDPTGAPVIKAVFTLPAASSEGMIFTFVAGDGSTFFVDPKDTDLIDYSTCAAGNMILSPGATGDSVTLISGSSKWYIANRSGTFTVGA
jgi:hypothetical protein